MRNQHHVLAMFHYDDALLSLLEQTFIVHRLWDAPDQARYLAELGPTVRSMLVSGVTRVDRQLIEALPELEIIATLGVGYDRIDLDAVRARGIRVVNAPATNSGCVADLAFALLIGSVRGLTRAERFVRSGRWPERMNATHPQLFYLTPRFYGKKLGILGLGQIGDAVARRARGFDLSIGYHNRRQRDDVDHPYFPTPLALAQWCDYLLVAAPGGPQAHHLVNGAVLDALGRDGVIVNVGRGTLVDQQALIERLRDGRLGGAGLDVFEDEPVIPEALLALENVVLTPHCAGVTTESGFDAMKLAIRNPRGAFPR